MTRRLLLSVCALACLLALPTTAHAQSAFAGVVKDATGAVLPGVMVEAASPALIEKVRSATTDTNGAYKIENLRPGVYSLTFNLPGFSGIKKDAIELPSNFTSTINAELKVGSLEETVTVSGESPVVDVQSNSKAQVMSRDVLDAVPSSHTIQSVGQLVVGVALTAPDVGGSQAMQQTYFTVHGLGAAQTSVMIDGMIVNGLQGDGAIQSYLNEGANQEMVYQTGGGTVDSPTGGVKINLIPKEGGNRFAGSIFQGYESSRLQTNNLTSSLAAQGIKTVDKIGTYSDTDITQGGPLKLDKVWFFGSLRLFTVNKPISNTLVSDGSVASIAACQAALAGKGGTLCAQGVDPQHQYSGLGRLTWQVSPRNKLAGYYDRVHKSRGNAMAPGDDQTTSSVVWNSPLYTTNSVKWTSTVSNKLLIEGGFSSNLERYNNLYQPGIEQPVGSILGARHVDSGAGTTWGASGFEYGSYPDRYNMQGSATYVTGSHSIKIGVQDSWGHYNQTGYANASLYQNYTQVAGVETSQTVTVYALPARWEESLNANLGVYAQDVWRLNRLTATYGLRWEYVSEQVDGQPAQQGRFSVIPAFSTIQMPTWKDISPRLGFVYDVGGDGKTALRFGFNRYEAAATTTLAALYDPANGGIILQSLPWTDGNKDDIAQGAPGCAFGTAGCEINFASLPSNFGTVSLASPDPGLTRPYVLQYNAGIQREIMRGVSASFEWFHTVSKNFMERNNINRPGTLNADGTVTNPSYRPFTVFSPVDGTPVTVYDVSSAAVGGLAAKNLDTNDAGLAQTYNSFEFGVNARLPRGGRLSGGFGTDRTIANTCSAAASNPNFLLTIAGVNYCDQTNSGIPWRTGIKAVGTYPLPWAGIIVSGSYQGLPGYILGTNALTAGGAGAPNFTAISGLAGALTVTSTTRYTACPGNSASQGCVVGALIAPGALSTLTAPLAPPGTQLTPRLNQLDLSIGKRIIIGRFKMDPKIDIFNALNSDAYFTARSTTYTLTATGAAPTAVNGSSGSYLLPGSIIQGRLLRIGAVVNW
jgi:Carboxypeptidase regulatory-like domain